VVERTPLTLAYVSPKWLPDNHGAVLVVPTAHHENLYAREPARRGRR
jgi:histidine triad (HIT) family protein